MDPGLSPRLRVARTERSDVREPPSPHNPRKHLPLTPNDLAVKYAPFLKIRKRRGLMADDIDIANDMIDNEVARALSKLRQNASQDAEGSKFCIECGERIPEGRKKLGFKLCVPCAEEEERRKALFAD